MNDDSQDPEYCPSPSSTPQRLVKRKRFSLADKDVKTEHDVEDMTPTRVAAVNCNVNLKKISDSHMLDDEMGSQTWLDQYLTRLGVDVPAQILAAGDSDIEDEPESQRLNEQGIGHAQDIIDKFKEQLDTTHRANTKLRVRFDRLELALKLAEESISAKKRELEEISAKHRTELESVRSQLNMSHGGKGQYSSLREELAKTKKELHTYKSLFSKLQQIFKTNDPEGLEKYLEGWKEVERK
ncbi:hypothetical protein VNI00_016012 [Paramarasmius palmivorus]|uniref:Uncharacterized protein n=1 Tax=Paramarasmius palmivorus TaxID=297713 RepID=A0AAW0BFW1_9AGAR